MITKKQLIMGAEVTFEHTPLQALRAFFKVKEPEEVSSVRFATEQYRDYRKKLVATSKKILFGAVTTGIEKEQAGLRRIREHYRRKEEW